MYKAKLKIEALKKARDMIHKMEEHYICYALTSVLTLNPHLEWVCLELKQYVRQSLCGHATLEGWQDAYLKDGYTRNTHIDRVAWIDWMIKSYEKMC